VPDSVILLHTFVLIHYWHTFRSPWQFHDRKMVL